MIAKHSKIITIIWLFLVVILHLYPSSGIPNVNWFYRLHGDKIIHLLMFLPLGFGLKKGFQLKNIQVVVITVFLAATLELIQGTILVGRTTDILDFCADILGVVLGIVIFNSK